jgi:uncharacterized membrane protein
MTRRRNLFLIAGLFFFAGAMHFVIPDRYASIIPAWMPSPMSMVYISGIFEMLGGIGVLVEPVRRFAGMGLIALLIAVFPANVQMLSSAASGDASPLYILLLFLRLPLQPIMIVWVYRMAVARRRSQAPLTSL